MSLTKVAVVTGSNKGIGLAIVKGLCPRFSGHVYLTARDVKRGENAVKELEKQGFHPKFHQLDINDQTSIDHFKDYLAKTYGGIDVLINNAAIAFKNDATESFAIQAEQTIAVNYTSLLRVCNTLFPLLRPHARVVHVSSSAGRLFRIPGADLRTKLGKADLTEPELSDLMESFVRSARNNKNEEDGWGNSAYVVSKVGVNALTVIHQRQFDADTSWPSGIHVNAVHPGYVDTDMTSHKGVLTTEQGADTPISLALLPQDVPVKGCFVWFNRQIVDWKADTVNVNHLP